MTSSNIVRLDGQTVQPTGSKQYWPWPEHLHKDMAHFNSSEKLRAEIVSLWELRTGCGKDADTHKLSACDRLGRALNAYDMVHAWTLMESLCGAFGQQFMADAQKFLTVMIDRPEKQKPLILYAILKWDRNHQGWVDWVMTEIQEVPNEYRVMAAELGVDPRWPG